jgi:uncharacterized membrane protein YphA (DoxX/SURF4 family)
VSFRRTVLKTSAPASVLLVRLAVGAIFLSEGVQKFLFPLELGAGRFAKIGLLTRLAAVMLVFDMLVAISTTKIPLLLKSGFWAAAHEARVDFAMLLGLLFLLAAGAGPLSADAHLSSEPHARDA